MGLNEIRGAIRMTAEDASRIKRLKQQIAYNLQNQFMAGGDNQDLKLRCDELARQIKLIENKYNQRNAA